MTSTKRGGGYGGASGQEKRERKQKKRKVKKRGGERGEGGTMERWGGVGMREKRGGFYHLWKS